MLLLSLPAAGCGSAAGSVPVECGVIGWQRQYMHAALVIIVRYS